jgi:protein-tyrosine phosphatase
LFCHDVFMTFTVLFVCTGNICRSPIGERLFQSRISRDADVSVTSAGTGALEGWGIDHPSALALRELGVAPEGHAGRRLTREIVEQSDLVLTAERAHRTAVVRMESSSSWRTFTLREFGRLAAHVPLISEIHDPDDLRNRVAEITAQRGLQATAGGPGLDDIGDPFGGAVDIARRTAAQVSEAVDTAIRALGLPARVALPAG